MPATTTTPALLQRYEVVSRTGAQISVGGQIRFYTIGTSNVAWQTWPDQVNLLLQRLGYIVPQSRYSVATDLHPNKIQLCDDAGDFLSLETPRVGRVGWASWGFAYESKVDCQATDFSGDVGRRGFRTIAGHQVSCINSWACDPAGDPANTLVRPSQVAADAREADVVLLSNWANDNRQVYSQYTCFQGVQLDINQTVALTTTDLRLLIRAIHSLNPQAKVLVMALYPDAAGQRVQQGNLQRIANINAQVKVSVELEPNTFFVDYIFPNDLDVFQGRSYGHANCRGDKVMATKVVETMFNIGLLARGLALPVGQESGSCLANQTCTGLSRSCCQRAASCQVAANGGCLPYGPGTF